MAKAVRVIYLDELLRYRRYTTRELAVRCGVSVWSIQRDLLDLQSEPLYRPLVQDEERRWYMLSRDKG